MTIGLSLYFQPSVNVFANYPPEVLVRYKTTWGKSIGESPMKISFFISLNLCFKCFINEYPESKLGYSERT